MNVGAVLVGGALSAPDGRSWDSAPAPRSALWAKDAGMPLRHTGHDCRGRGICRTVSFFKSTVLAWKDFGKVGLPDVLGISHWVIAAVFWVLAILLFAWFEKEALILYGLEKLPRRGGSIRFIVVRKHKHRMSVARCVRAAGILTMDYLRVGARYRGKCRNVKRHGISVGFLGVCLYVVRAFL